MEHFDFFISYTQVDRPWAEWIAWQLEDAGYTSRIQAWDFLPGSNFVQEMDQATQAQRTLLVLSNEYFHSNFTKPEWQVAFAHDPTGAKRKIVAVKVRECHPEGLLGQIVWINVMGLGEQEAKQALLDGVKGERLKPLTPPPFPGAVPHSLRQAPDFPEATSTKTGSPAAPQPSSLENDPTLILAAKQHIEKAFKHRPSQLTTRTWMQVVWTPIQQEEVLDPNQFIDPSFVRTVIKLARQGEPSLFDDMSEVAKNASIAHVTITQQQGRGPDESHIRVVLYSDGTLSLAFTGLHQSRETHSFSQFILDEDVISTRLYQAASFAARWYDYQDPHRIYNHLCYNIGFYDLQFHRFGQTPSSQKNSFNPSTKSRPNPLFVYEAPRNLPRNSLQHPDNLINHAITRARFLFHE